MREQGSGRLLPDGCPWDAIVMLDIAEVEKIVGAMAF
jgi:hypothetical protein